MFEFKCQCCWSHCCRGEAEIRSACLLLSRVLTHTSNSKIKNIPSRCKPANPTLQCIRLMACRDKDVSCPNRCFPVAILANSFVCVVSASRCMTICAATKLSHLNAFDHHARTPETTNTQSRRGTTPMHAHQTGACPASSPRSFCEHMHYKTRLVAARTPHMQTTHCPTQHTVLHIFTVRPKQSKQCWQDL